MIEITFNYYGRIAKGILLGKYQRIHEEHEIVKKRFFWKIYEKHKVKKIDSPLYIIFIPWKHQEKEIIEIDEKKVIEIGEVVKEENWINVDKYTSCMKEDYWCKVSIKVKNFNGYKFIYDNNSFIVNLVSCNYHENLNIIYKMFPEFLELNLENIEK